MAQVQTLELRFMRRIQVREYEPTEAECKLTAQLADGDQPGEIAATMFALASDQVHIALGLPANTKLATRAAGHATHKTQAQNGGTATKEHKVSAPVGAGDIPEEIPGEAAPQTGKQTAAPQKAPAGDIPEEIPGETAQPQTHAADKDGVTDAPSLSKWIGEQVRLGKVSSDAVKATYPKYKIARFADLKPDQVPTMKAELDGLIKAHSAAADL